MIAIFYNPSLDCLFLTDSASSKPEKTVKAGDLTVLLKEGKAIGYNLFNPRSYLINPVDGFNAKIEGYDKFAELAKEAGYPIEKAPTGSEYTVCLIESSEEHPLYENARILYLNDGQKKLTTVTRYQNCQKGDRIVVKTGGYRLDGTIFSPKVEKNIAIDGEVCSPFDLKIGEESKAAYIEKAKKEGEDYFRA